MRLVLTVYDEDERPLKITGTAGPNFAELCRDLNWAMNAALWTMRTNEPCTTVSWEAGMVRDIMEVLERFGGMEDLPTAVSC